MEKRFFTFDWDFDCHGFCNYNGIFTVSILARYGEAILFNVYETEFKMEYEMEHETAHETEISAAAGCPKHVIFKVPPPGFAVTVAASPKQYYH